MPYPSTQNSQQLCILGIPFYKWNSCKTHNPFPIHEQENTNIWPWINGQIRPSPLSAAFGSPPSCLLGVVIIYNPHYDQGSWFLWINSSSSMCIHTVYNLWSYLQWITLTQLRSQLQGCSQALGDLWLAPSKKQNNCHTWGNGISTCHSTDKGQAWGVGNGFSSFYY